jgi:choline dehydrogenase-like flavoprotein
MDASDVIIMGTAPAGHILARHRAPSGKRVRLARARRLVPARALLPRHAYLTNEIPVAGCAHQAGTCRFDTDLAASALNTGGCAHELDNFYVFYVVDTSVFPSIGAVNPLLTAMANALRVGDHLVTRLA